MTQVMQMALACLGPAKEGPGEGSDPEAEQKVRLKQLEIEVLKRDQLNNELLSLKD